MQTIIFTALITLGLCFAGFVTYGQTFSEWWQQKKTRIKYLHRQIAALDELRELLREGYWQSEEEEDSVELLSAEEYEIRRNFLESLKSVKPALKDTPEVMSSMMLTTYFSIRACQKLEEYAKDPVLSSKDFSYIRSELDYTLDAMKRDVKWVDLLLADESIEMKDDERYWCIRFAARQIRMNYERGTTVLYQLDEMVASKRQEQANNEFIRNSLN